MSVTKGKILAIDHGLKRIGVAISDSTGLTARELAVIRRTSKQEDFDKLHAIIATHQPTAIVIGLPANLDLPDGVHSQADTVRLWTERFRETTSLSIVFWDEQMSSVDALELARQKRRRTAEPIDDLAARVILQSYLDAVRDGLAEWPVSDATDPAVETGSVNSSPVED